MQSRTMSRINHAKKSAEEKNKLYDDVVRRLNRLNVDSDNVSLLYVYLYNNSSRTTGYTYSCALLAPTDSCQNLFSCWWAIYVGRVLHNSVRNRRIMIRTPCYPNIKYIHQIVMQFSTISTANVYHTKPISTSFISRTIMNCWSTIADFLISWFLICLKYKGIAKWMYSLFWKLQGDWQ